MALSPMWTQAESSIVSGFAGSPDTIGNGSGLHDGLGGTLLDGVKLTASLSAMYDSNIDQRAAAPGESERDDFILGLGGNVKYLSKSTDWTFGANYRGYLRQYVEQTDSSGYDQSAGAVVQYEGGRISASLDAKVSYDEGSNRNYNSAVVEEVDYGIGLTTRYKLSSKTTVEGKINQSYSTTIGDEFGDTEALDLGVSALWRYSPLTEWGPGLRYTFRSGSSQVDRNTIGPTIKVDYKLSTKVSLDSQMGVDFTSYDGKSGDPSFAAALGLKYKASKLWDMSLAIVQDTEADPSNAGAFTEVTSLRLGYTRKIRRAELGLGVSYSANRAELPDEVTTTSEGEDRDYYSVDGKIGMLIFAETTAAELFLRYSEQSSNLADTWDAVQVGVRLSRSF
ncbi:hypothetical protein GCM10023212_06710 [Luteolibacter yonseiensis]